MKPATLSALLQGDIENAIIAEMPGGIEAQEARGQRDFVASETLPKECSFCTREQLEQMGITFGEDADDLFVHVQLPDGWNKIPTDHSMWSNLVDERGRERAKIFYKAAFYDRRASINLTARFSCHVDPVRGWDDPDYQDGNWHCVVLDAGKVVWAADEQVEPEPHYSEDSREAWLDWRDRKSKLGNLGKEWLEEHYPNWRDPLAYWEEEEC